MAGNSTGLYGTTTSNPTILPNNNTGLYNTGIAPIPINGNITANNITATGNVSVGGYVSAVGNVTGNYVLGNGYYLTDVQVSYSNANVANYLPIYSGAISASTISTTGSITSAATIYGNTLTITGNITANGNISAAYYQGNGSQLTGIISSYSNANVANLLPVYTGNISAQNISATGNITASILRTPGNLGNIIGVNYTVSNFFVGDGSLLTNLPVQPGTYGNANVAAYLPTYTGNITAGNVSATGNIAGNYFIGNGSQLTGITTNYSNANVAAYLPVYSGNITAGNISVSGNITDGNLSTSGNITTGNLISTNLVSATWMSATANIQAGILLNTGNIVRLGTAAGNATSSAANTIAIGRSAGANTQGDGSIAIGQNAGNTTQAGNSIAIGRAAGQTTQNANAIAIGRSAGNNSQGIETIAIGHLAANNAQGNYAVAIGYSAGSNNQPANSIMINASANALNGNNAGFYVNPVRYDTGNTANVVYFNAATNELTYAAALSSSYGNSNVAAYLPTDPTIISIQANAANTNSNVANNTSNITTLQSQVTSLTGNVYGNANVAAYLPTYTGNISAGNVSVTGNVYAPEIVSSNVTVYGNSIITGNLTVQGTTTTINSNVVTVNDLSVLLANNISNIAQLQGAGITAGNSAGNSLINFTYNVGSNAWSSNIGIGVTGNLSATGNIQGSYILGNGSQLTGLPIQPGTYSNTNVTSLLSSGTYTGDIQALTGVMLAAAISSSGTVTANANVTGNNIISLGYVTAANGLESTSTYPGPYSDGVVVDYLTGTARISVGTNDNIRFYNGGIANTVLGGFNSTGAFSAIGNITGNYFIGNGSQLTGITSTYSNANVVSLLSAFGSNSISTSGQVESGTVVADTSLTSNGSLLVTGNAQVNSNLKVIGNMSATGNVSVTGNISTPANISAYKLSSPFLNVVTVANISGQTFLGLYDPGNSIINDTSVQANLNVGLALAVTGAITSASTISATGNITGNVLKGTQVSVSGNITGNNITATGNISSGNISASGNIVGRFINIGNDISAVGNATASYFIGNGSQLTGIVATANYSNANVANYLPTYSGAFTAATVTATGNISGNYILGNGSQLTGLPATYGNSNVAAYLPTYSGNLTAGNVSVTGNITTGNIINLGTESVTGNITGGNILTIGLISATGNVSGNYFIGNGSLLTGISGGSYGNSNVAAYLPTYTGNIGNTGNSVSVQFVNYKDVSLASANANGTITPNVSLGSIQTLTLTGNITYNAFGGTPQAGQSLTLILTQDTTGNRLLTSNMKFAGGAKTLSSAANATDIIYTFFDGTTYWATLSRAYQ